MRIERIEIDGFGRFHDARWDLAAGLTVLVGENEAGKSTLLNAIRALLFGFDSTRDGRTWYPALEGGRRGGRLVLRTATDERWTVERHGERGGGGALVVRAPNGNQGGQETLDRLLHGADRDLFMNIFAFGLGELQAIGSLSGDGVRGRIYGAGSGLGGINALDIERRLRAEQEATFKARGRDTSLDTLNGLLSRIDELHAEIGRLEQQPAEYEAARGELAEIAARRAAIGAERLTAAERADRLGRLLRAQPPAAELVRLERELAAGEAADDTLPSDAEARFDRRAGALAVAAERLRDQEARLERVEARLAAVVIDRRLEGVAAEAAALRDERALHDGRLAALDAERATVTRLDAHLAEQAQRAGGSGEAQLLAVDDSIAALEATREHERTMAAARAAVEDVRRRRDGLREEVGRDGTGTAGDVPDAAALAGRAAALDALLRADIRAATLGEAPPPSRLPLAAVLGVAVAGAIFAGALAGTPLLGLVVAAALAAGAAVVLWPRRHLAPGAAPAEREELLRRAGLSPHTRAEEVGAARDEIAAARARATLGADDARRRDERALLLDRAARDLADAGGALERAVAAWGTWLTSRDLPRDLSPEAARATLALVEQARRTAAQRDEARGRVVATEAAARAFEERLTALLTSVTRDVPTPASVRAAALSQLIADVDRDAAARHQRAELEEARDELRAAHAPLLTDRDEALAALRDLLADLGVRDEDELRARSQRAAERRATRAELREQRAGLVAIAGAEAALAALVADARQLDPSAAAAQRDAVLAVVRRLDDEEREALTRAGALGERVAQLESSEELGRRRQELAELQGRAEAEAHRWAVRAVTLQLLAETRQRYERERQPDVVRDAERHFERITGGRWPRIIAPPGELTVEVETEGGATRRPEELSRGTAEQLYLALRFGLIEQFAAHAEPLPVVMDEILVNFDPARAERTASAILDLASRHQVLYFTCQPPTAALLDPGGGRTVALG